MKSPKIFVRSLFIALLLITGACDGFLDVNENPAEPADVPEHLILSGLQGNFSYNVIGGDPARITTLWIQQTAVNGAPPSVDNYNVDESGVNNLWSMAYSGVLNNARDLNELAEANGNDAYAGMAKVIMAWSFSILTDYWDEIPYQEALDPLPDGTSSPSYDSQELVYEKILNLLDQALADFDQYDSGNIAYAPLGDHDLLYGGDIGRWERMTHSLLGRLHMRLTEAPGYDAEEQATAALEALSKGFNSNADDADFRYLNDDGQENPWYQYTIHGKWPGQQQLSAHYISLLEDLDDPRLAIQARPAGAVNNNGLVSGFNPENPEYIGHRNGETAVDRTAVSSIGAFYSDSDAPLNWLSFAEAKFIEAEANLVLGNGAEAQSAYEEGIRASMEKLGVDAGDIDEYIDDRPTLAVRIGQDESLALSDIITQKYIANFLNYEAYNDWRRTGYPELEPAASPLTPSGIIPLRFPYPSSELSNNAANVAEKGIPAGFEALEIPVWWNSGS